MQPATERLSSAPPPTVEELQGIKIFADLPQEDLRWLASVMHALDIQTDEVLVRRGDEALYMVALLSGEMRSDLGNGRTFIGRAGQITGMLPFSRLKVFPGTGRATQPTRVAGLHKDLFPEMMQRIPVLQSRLVGVLADRVREATAADQQREKMAALGKLSAGLAHELNNPASAARRAADELRKSLSSVRTASLKLDKEGLPQESRIFLAELECNRRQLADGEALDSLERNDREEEISAWLSKRSVEAPWSLASTLVDLGCTLETLEDVERHVPRKFLTNVLIRLTAAFTISRLADQIENSTGRISELVRAVKEYSYMDRAAEQDIDIHEGLENTLIMLHHKLKNGMTVVREYDRTIPRVQARGSELNQIWTNLIVNAVDATQGKGTITIRTIRDHNCARVEVEDDGPGIPEEIKTHIFDPFFTTKPVGEGTGLGLDIVYRIVRNHGGDISFTSRPGQTCFVIRIPFGPGFGVASS